MLKANHSILGVGVLALLSCGPVLADQNPPPNASTVVEVGSLHPTDLPILLTVVVTNNGNEPIAYWSSGAHYPPATWFSARLKKGDGELINVNLSNDQGLFGGSSGGFEQIDPGKSITVPALMEALPVGSYTIQIWNGKAETFAVKDDPEAIRKWDQALVPRIRKGEQFAFNVARTHIGGKKPHDWLLDAMLEDLSSDNNQIADRAADLLILTNHLPLKASTIVNKALMKRISLVREQGLGTWAPDPTGDRIFGFVRLKERGFARTELLVTLAGIAAQIGTDEALQGVLSLAETKQVRGTAISALGAFKQEKALKELRLFLTDQDEDLQFRAAQRLAERKDPPALDVLLTVAHNPKSRWRMYSFDALLNYPNDSRVEPTIKSGLDDPDSQVRQSAEFALRQLANQKKPKP